MDAEERRGVAKRDPDRGVDGEHLGGYAREVRPRVDVVAAEHHALRKEEKER